MTSGDLPGAAYRESYAQRDGVEYWLEKVGTGRQLVVKAADSAAYEGFSGSSDGDSFRADITGDNAPQCLVTELTTLQRQIIKLLGLSPTDYGH